MRTVLLKNKAQKYWRFARKLIIKGIHTPLPVAYLRYRRSFFFSEYIIITEGVRKAIRLDDAVLGITNREKKALILSVAKFVGDLHSNGIYHGDFNAGNILVKKVPNYSKFVKIKVVSVQSTSEYSISILGNQLRSRLLS